MTESREHQRFHKAVDSTLSGLQGDPFLYQRVAARLEEGERGMKHRKWKLGLAIVLAAMVCMMTVAAAGGWLGGYVNWKGEVIPEEPRSMLPGPTAAPEMPMDKGSFLQAQELVQTAQEMEIVCVEVKNRFGGTSTTHNRLEKHPDTYDAFLTLMADAPQLPVPGMIPEGYEFVHCQVVYDCRADGEYVLTSETMLEDGSVVRRYRVSEEDAFVSAYSLLFRRNGDPEDYLSVNAGLRWSSNPDEHHIGVNADQTAQVMEVAGMDNAILIAGETRCMLTMRRKLQQRVDYLYDDLSEVRRRDSYREVQIDVAARQIDAEVLSAMFAGQ